MELTINEWHSVQVYFKFIYTYIDQAKVVLIDRKLLGSNLFLQCRGIGALKIDRNTCIP